MDGHHIDVDPLTLQFNPDKLGADPISGRNESPRHIPQQGTLNMPAQLINAIKSASD